MSTLLTVKQVKSLTIGFALPETYDMSRVEEIKVYLGKNVYPHTIDERVVKCQIKSDDTAVMYGVNRLSFWLDDSIIGVYPVYCGDIVFEYTNAIEHNESVNTLFDVMVNLTISETAITVDSVLYNILKGDKGDAFLYSDFTPEQVEALKVKGDKGDSFEYEDFTPEQITVLQQPATDIASTVSQAEGLRVTAESGRVTAEGLRVTAESNRSGAELLRSGAESDRSGAELLRAGAENTREGNEQDREQAEALRVQAEIDRQTNTGTAIQNANTATGLANDAAALANTKAGLANDAATNANTKAGLADTAATNANTKAGLANTAATNADNARLAIQVDLAGKQATLVSGTNIKTVNGQSLVGSGDVSNLIASYTHSGNKEVYISSIDYGTNTFTSVGHGLINSADSNKTLMLAINRNATIYPYNVMPFNPIDLTTDGLFVVNATSDTFQLSKTAGGAVITLINKAENDLTKWHFEYTTVKTITISGLLGKINAGVKTVIDGTIIWGYAQYIGAAGTGMIYIKSSDGATPSFNHPTIYGRNDYPVPCFGGQIIHTDIYTNNGHRKIFDIAVYGYGTALNKVAMTNKYINFISPIVIADSSKSYVKLDGVSISNGTTIKVYTL